MADLVLGSKGDLVVSQYDLAIELNEAEVLASSLRRRIKSNIEQYSLKLIDSSNNLITIDSNYGADLVNNLSSPLDSVLQITDRQVREVLRQETRLTNYVVSTYPLNEYTVKIIINYTYKGVQNTLEL